MEFLMLDGRDDLLNGSSGEWQIIVFLEDSFLLK